MIKAKVQSSTKPSIASLPSEILASLQVEEGDTVCFVQTEQGYEIRVVAPEEENEIDVAQSVMDKYKDALHELSK